MNQKDTNEIPKALDLQNQTQRAVMSLRLDKELDEALTTYAQAQRLTKTAAIKQVLIEHLRQKKLIKTL